MRNLIAILLLVSVAASARADAAEIITGSAAAIDAETLSLGGRTLRLDGIAGPAPAARCSEIAGAQPRDYACGLAAKAFLMSLLAGQTISCVSGDERGRSVMPARCFVEGRDVGEALIESGWAIADTRTGGRYIPAQEGARGARRGLWSGRFDPPGKDPVPR